MARKYQDLPPGDAAATDVAAETSGAASVAASGGASAAAPNEAEITARYGLEPVFEPGAPQGSADSDSGVPADPLAPFVQVQCPYCGEPFETRLDLSGGSASYVEDCQVCCQPIEFVTEVDAEGALESLELRRGD